LRQSSAAADIRASNPQQVTANPHGVHDHDDDDAETFSALDVEHNEIYACASIFFLVVTIPDFFAGEVAHRGIAQLLELCRFCCYWCSTLFNYNRYFCNRAFFDLIEWLKDCFLDLYLYLIF